MDIQELVNRAVQIGLNGKMLSVLLSTTAFSTLSVIEKKSIRYNKKTCKPKNECKYKHACLEVNGNCPDEE